MTALVIVESPAKCKKIESYLGPGYKCLASFGHIRQLGKGLECIDMDNNFVPKFVIATGKQKYISKKHFFFRKIYHYTGTNLNLRIYSLLVSRIRN